MKRTGHIHTYNGETYNTAKDAKEDVALFQLTIDPVYLTDVPKVLDTFGNMAVACGREDNQSYAVITSDGVLIDIPDYWNGSMDIFNTRMSEDEYVKEKVACCPNCRSEDIEAISLPENTDIGIVEHKIVCNSCDFKWMDIYNLTSYFTNIQD
jgi:hypothetical protein